jgi:hypothetical protein
VVKPAEVGTAAARARDPYATDAQLAERARAWVERTRAAQGVSVKISDPHTIAEVARILRTARERRQA